MFRPSVAPPPWLLVAAVVALLGLLPARVPVAVSTLPEVFDPRFGAVEAFRAPDRAGAAGVRWSRLVFSWSAIQPTGAGSSNWGYFPDHLLQRELAAGRGIVGLLIGTPAWAGPGSPSSVPRGLELPVEDQQNHWARFARTIAERYRGRIDHWVIWNEPDIWDPASALYTWDGSIEDFYRLQKVGYRAIKQGNPAARVALPGLTYWWDQAYGREQWLERYLQVAQQDPEAAANGFFFDAAVLHLYNDPRQLATVPELFHGLMARRGLGKPIWVNETNVPTWDDPASPMPRDEVRVTQDQQASYVVQAFACGLAAGVERISIYPFSEANAGPADEPMGLVRGDGSTRPAYAALQTVARHFRGVNGGRLEREGDAVKVMLERDGGSLLVAWSAAPRPARISVAARARDALLVDKYGRESTIEPVDGRYHLTLEAAPLEARDRSTEVRIGGNPVLLIEP